MGDETARTYVPVNINPFITHPAHERLYHTTGVYAPLLFMNSSVGSFTSHKNQNRESAVRQGLWFFILIQED